MMRNGLRAFCFHTEDEVLSEAVDTLQAQRWSFSAFLMMNDAGLTELDPENRETNSESLVLSEAGNTGPERATIDIPRYVR